LIELNFKRNTTHVRCTLCMHPIAYYEDSWAGAMCPTDDVIAALMMMRGDEPMFWRTGTRSRARELLHEHIGHIRDLAEYLNEEDMKALDKLRALHGLPPPQGCAAISPDSPFPAEPRPVYVGLERP
jgi:hypothetical protein